MFPRLILGEIIGRVACRCAGGDGQGCVGLYAPELIPVILKVRRGIAGSDRSWGVGSNAGELIPVVLKVDSRVAGCDCSWSGAPVDGEGPW